MQLSQEEIRQLFSAFNDINVLVVGDVMIDSYIWGKVERISPEAPVPIVTVQKYESTLGGAANVALNLKALGANPVLVSVIGNDKSADELLQLMQKQDLPVDGILKSDQRITTTKSRILGNKTQLLRIDEEIEQDLNVADTEKLLFKIEEVLSGIDVVVLEDYNKGVLTEQIISGIIQMANDRNIPVAVDPKKKNFNAYRKVTLFKPNFKELCEGLKIEVDIRNLDSLQEAADKLHESQEIQMVLCTLSEHGIFISRKHAEGKEHHLLPAHLRSIADVSGAGDSVISVAALLLAQKRSPEEIAAIANLAGGLVCEQVGVVPVDKAVLLDEALKRLGK